MVCRANFDRGMVGVHKQFRPTDPFLDCSFILRSIRLDGAIPQEAIPDKGSDKKSEIMPAERI